MEKPYKSDSNDFSDEFIPLWRRFRQTQNILMVIWGLFVLGLFFRNSPVIGNVLNILFPILFIPTFIWMLFFLFKLKCPKCGWPIFSDVGLSFFYFTGECPCCYAQLKNRILSNEAEKRLRRTIGVIFLIFFIAMIITAFLTGGIRGIQIIHTHIDAPKCGK